MAYSVSCDLCKQPYYNPPEERNVNKRHNGHPIYRVCRHCYDFSVPKKIKGRFGLLKGSPYPPVQSGKKFSQNWNKVYTYGKKMVENNKGHSEKNRNMEEDKTPESKEKQSGHEKKQEGKQEEKPLEYINKTMMDAVHVVESGVSGLVKGASEALSSLSPFSS